jgi:tRNA threonylcarbamoyladenosine biosynthesis protein TsaE
MMALYGDLGSGKTCLVRGIADGLDAPRRAVSSPTFVFVHTYDGRLPLIHADLYRLDTTTDLHHLGLEEYFDERTVVAVEWAEKAQSALPSDHLEIHLGYLNRTSRSVSFHATGSRSSELLQQVISAYAEHERACDSKKAPKRRMVSTRSEATNPPRRKAERR